MIDLLGGRCPERLEMELTKAANDVLAERCRQVEAEGWTPEHDDAHGVGELAIAAACYAGNAAGKWGIATAAWPWAPKWWKPTNARRDLVKAGALILAEIERLDRQPPNVEVTGAARLYRAASSDQRERG